MTSTPDGFGQVLRGEWTKFWTVRSTVWCLLAAVGLTVLLSLFAASVASSDANDQRRFNDQMHFVHQPLSGDGTVIARVTSQQRSHEWAKAGLMIKASTATGSPYAAIMTTPDHGVRLQANFDTDIPGSSATPRPWLKLTRAGMSITGYSSADGTSWSPVGTVDVRLPRTAEIGLFVSSPTNLVIAKSGFGGGADSVPTMGTATFDSVSRQAGPWTGEDLNAGAGPGSSTESGGTFTVTGSGDVAGYGIASWVSPGFDDVVKTGLIGVQIGLMAVVALGVMAMTSEYRTGLARTTFTASPRRGRVLAAKATILGGTVFVAGLVASLAAFLLSQPALRANGYGPPAYPQFSLFDGPALRAVVGTALFLAVLAVFSLGIGAIRRRTAGGIITVVALLVVPQILAPIMSLNADIWIRRLTPVAGLAIQQTKEQFDTAISPWAGFAVLCGYAAAVLAIAFWKLRRRDA